VYKYKCNWHILDYVRTEKIAGPRGDTLEVNISQLRQIILIIFQRLNTRFTESDNE